MACRRCDERGQTWAGEHPTCAFPDNAAGGDAVSLFKADNWNCATLNALRQLAGDRDAVVYNDDYHAALLAGPEDSIAFVYLRWYKNRGRTDEALWMDTGEARPITLMEAEWVLEQAERSRP